MSMRTYVMTLKTNNDSCVLVNGAETIELKEKTVIDKIRKNEIVLINKEVQKVGRKNVLVDIPYNGILSEQILFDIYLAEIIKENEYNDEILFIVLSKIKSLYFRSQDLKENKDLFSHCIGILRRYFNYMGRTKVDIPFIKEDIGIAFKNRNSENGDKRREKVYRFCKDKFDTSLLNFRQVNSSDSDVEKWYRGDSNVLLYRCFLPIIENVYSNKNDDEFNAVYDILKTFFSEINYTFLGGYLFAAYSKALILAINKEIEKNDVNEFIFNDLSPSDRAIKAKEGISLTNKGLQNYKRNLQNISESYERLVRRYDKSVISLLSNLNSNSFLDRDEKIKEENKNFSGIINNSNNNIDRDKLYLSYLDISTATTCELINKFNQFISKNTEVKDCENLLKLFDYSKKIGEVAEVPILNGVGDGGKVACEIVKEVKKEVKSSKEKYLGPYSKQFIDEFYKYKQYEIDILSFLLDIRRYYIQEQENKKKLNIFKKSEDWFPIFCVRELKPMAIIYCYDFNDGRMYLNDGLTSEIKNWLVLSWLSTYYFFNRFVKKNAALSLDWALLYFKTVMDFVELVHVKKDEIKLIYLRKQTFPMLAKRLSEYPFYWKIRNTYNSDVRDMLKENV